MSKHNDELRTYLKLGQEIEALEARRAELRRQILDRGTHSTANFICVVSEQVRRQPPSLSKLEKYPDLYAQIEPMIEHKVVQMVKVTAKS